MTTVNQAVLKLFPRTTNSDKIVIDERCDCGHLRSVHQGTNSLNAGHGGCTSCACAKFTWTAHVFKSARKAR